MSTIAPALEPEVLLDANGNPIESWGGKFERKFKENPFVPVLAGLTTASLIIAATKLRRRDSTALNHWLRVRVVMQGLTIVAIVGGSWWYGQMKHQKEAAAAVEQERILERAAFESRLRAAEEADRMERLEEEQARKATAQGSSGGGWMGGWWGKSPSK
ncbi:hypothetical protein C8Q76DRAFT_804474 [Earliella scabrosa]|nr:hypothetical protein C8Q76DRAFT_804474 [Earliella scabrosa]